MFRPLMLMVTLLVAGSGCAVAGSTQARPTAVPTVSTPAAPPTVTRSPASPTAATLAPIVVTDPAEGATVTSPIKIAGSASVFEAAVSIRIKDSSGKVVKEAFTTASQGAPGRGDYSVSVPVDISGPAVIEVFSQSARDGSDQFLVKRNVIIGR